MDKKEVYRKAWDTWRWESQMLMLVEECAELQHATLRVVRKYGGDEQPGFDAMQATYGKLAEELADVEIMIEQVKTQYPDAPGGRPFAEYIEGAKRRKLNRLQMRLEAPPARVPKAHANHGDEKLCGCVTEEDFGNKDILKIKCRRCGSSYLFCEVSTFNMFICYDCGNDVTRNGILFRTPEEEVGE